MLPWKGQPAVSCGDFLITETYLTTFVSHFFNLTNFWFNPTDTQGVLQESLGVGAGTPKVIFFITEAYVTITVTFVDWAKYFFIGPIHKPLDRQT